MQSRCSAEEMRVGMTRVDGNNLALSFIIYVALRVIDIGIDCKDFEVVNHEY